MKKFVIALVAILALLPLVLGLSLSGYQVYSAAGGAGGSTSASSQIELCYHNIPGGCATFDYSQANNLGNIEISSTTDSTSEILAFHVNEEKGFEATAEILAFKQNDYGGWNFVRPFAIEVPAGAQSFPLNVQFRAPELQLVPGSSPASVVLYLPGVMFKDATGQSVPALDIITVSYPAPVVVAPTPEPTPVAPLPGTPTIPQPPVGATPGGVIINPIESAEVPGLENTVPYESSISYDGSNIYVYSEPGARGAPFEGFLSLVHEKGLEAGELNLVAVDKAPASPVSVTNGIVVPLGDLVGSSISSFNAFDVAGGFLRLITGERVAAAPVEGVCEIESLVATEASCKSGSGTSCAYSFSVIPGFGKENTQLSENIGMCTYYPKVGAEGTVTVSGCEIKSLAVKSGDEQDACGASCKFSSSPVLGFEDINWVTCYPTSGLGGGENPSASSTIGLFERFWNWISGAKSVPKYPVNGKACCVTGLTDASLVDCNEGETSAQCCTRNLPDSQPTSMDNCPSS